MRCLVMDSAPNCKGFQHTLFTSFCVWSLEKSIRFGPLAKVKTNFMYIFNCVHRTKLTSGS